jgi:hypothetical protein
MNTAILLNDPNLRQHPKLRTLFGMMLTIAERTDPERKDPLWEKVFEVGGLK